MGQNDPFRRSSVLGSVFSVTVLTNIEGCSKVSVKLFKKENQKFYNTVA